MFIRVLFWSQDRPEERIVAHGDGATMRAAMAACFVPVGVPGCHYQEYGIGWAGSDVQEGLVTRRAVPKGPVVAYWRGQPTDVPWNGEPVDPDRLDLKWVTKVVAPAKAAPRKPALPPALATPAKPQRKRLVYKPQVGPTAAKPGKDGQTAKPAEKAPQRPDGATTQPRRRLQRGGGLPRKRLKRR